MDKIEHNISPTAVTILNCTPDQLRTIADRLDQELKRASTGQVILYPLTSKIMLSFSFERKGSEH
jgi:hypothetical protein